MCCSFNPIILISTFYCNHKNTTSSRVCVLPLIICGVPVLLHLLTVLRLGLGAGRKTELLMQELCFPLTSHIFLLCLPRHIKQKTVTWNNVSGNPWLCWGRGGWYFKLWLGSDTISSLGHRHTAAVWQKNKTHTVCEPTADLKSSRVCACHLT